MLNVITSDRPLAKTDSTLADVNSKVEERAPDLLRRASYSFSRRTYLVSRMNTVWLIRSGAVRTLTYLEDGSLVTLGLWSIGDVVGESLSTIKPYIIEALTPVEVTPISLEEWQPSPQVLLNYIQQTEAVMMSRANRRVEEALLSILNWLAYKFGRQIEEGQLIDLKLTHQDLAELVGTTRVTVTRILKHLESQGLIYRQSRHLVLAQTQQHWHYEI